MNLVRVYIDTQQTRAKYTYEGIWLTQHQRKMLDALREKVRRGETATTRELRAPRGSGKTFVLLKLAQELNVPLVTPSKVQANELSRSNPNVEVISQYDIIYGYFRGRGTNQVVVDESVDIQRIKEHGADILTGIEGGLW